MEVRSRSVFRTDGRAQLTFASRRMSAIVGRTLDHRRKLRQPIRQRRHAGAADTVVLHPPTRRRPLVRFIRIARRPVDTRAALKAVASLALASACIACRADDPTAAAPRVDVDRESLPEALRPRAFFAQLGMADEVTAGTAGLIWDPKWKFLPASWSVYVEASVSRWQSRGGYPSDRGVLTQTALIPVFRWRGDEGGSPWFVEGGVGVTVTSTLYRHADTRFSTSFNFGDHVGAGYSFGQAKKNEVVLRLEHFSNAGIKHPNPGQNFVELRYVRHFD